MDTATKTPATSEFKVEVDKAIVKGTFNVELTKQFDNYQNLLTLASSIKFTPDNLKTEGEILKTVRATITAIDKLREAKKKPYFDAGKIIDAAAKELSAPLQEVLDAKTAEYKIVYQKVEQEKERINKENQRVSTIKQAINSFILEVSQVIAGAKTAKEIEAVEKSIGTHKTNKVMYQEFLPDLVERVKELQPLIKKQKDAINKLEELEKQKKAASKKGDDREVLKIMGKQEVLQDKIEEGKVVVQETAVNQAVSGGVTVPEMVATSAPSARRTVWKAELVDVKEAFKKSPELLDVTLNATKISASIKTLKDAGMFTGKTEVVINGIRYYEEKTLI